MQKITSAGGNGKLKEEIESLKPWFHNLHLPGDIQTAPDHYYGDFPHFKWLQFAEEIPENLEGWTALDIGCNAGYYSFELAKRGAKVLGIDLDPHYLKQARWAAEQMQLSDKVEFRQMQVYDLSKLEQQFDLVIFMGVFYHLRYPMLAMDIVCQKVNKMLVFQTLTMPGNDALRIHDLKMDERKKMLESGWPLMAFIEERLAGDPTNWWAPNHSCIEAMLRTCGMNVKANPGHEIYICHPDEKLNAVTETWNRSEFLSATGNDWTRDLEDKVKDKQG
jgi:tRNA (mo5U34)-methyltransferase